MVGKRPVYSSLYLVIIIFALCNIYGRSMREVNILLKLHVVSWSRSRIQLSVADVFYNPSKNYMKALLKKVQFKSISSWKHWGKRKNCSFCFCHKVFINHLLQMCLQVDKQGLITYEKQVMGSYQIVHSYFLVCSFTCFQFKSTLRNILGTLENKGLQSTYNVISSLFFSVCDLVYPDQCSLSI